MRKGRDGGEKKKGKKRGGGEEKTDDYACSPYTELGSNTDKVIVTTQISMLVTNTLQQTPAPPAKQ